MKFFQKSLKKFDSLCGHDTILVMKKKEITLERIVEKIDSIALDVRNLRADVQLLRLDSQQFRKDLNCLDERTSDMQDDIRIILELAKGNDGTLGMWQIATAR